MIDIFSWPTPSGHKVHIMLNNKIPAITGPDGKPLTDNKARAALFGKTQYEKR